MRRFLVLGLGLLTALGCETAPEQNLLEPSSGPEGVPAPPAEDISDANNGGNQHFFWLPPVAPWPGYSGVPLRDISPVVEVCLLDRQVMACDPQVPLLAEFTMGEWPFFDRVFQTRDGNFWVTWRRARFDPEDGSSYRVSVKMEGIELGFFDVEVRSGGRWWNLTRNDGFIEISDRGPFLMGFRIEEGALEEAVCDAQSQGLEDCDVQVIDDTEGGVLRLFEDPGGPQEAPAAVIVIPQNSALLDGEPISDYLIIAELEDDGVNQGGNVPQNRQVPYFVDLTTEPAGVSFDQNGDGLRITLCQDLDFLENTPEALHGQLRPFLVFQDGTTVFPEDYTVGAPECEGFGITGGDHSHGGAGLAARLSQGISRLAGMFGPSPLMARRLHGGLNTTVYNTRGNTRDSDTDEGGEAGAPFAESTQEFVLELGAILDVDPFASVATVPNGEVGVSTEILIEARNGLGDPFPFGSNSVEVVIQGANPGLPEVTDNGDGTYSASYTPQAAGEDEVRVFLNGYEISGSPYVSVVQGFGTIVATVMLDGSPLSGVQIALFDHSSQVASVPSGFAGQASFPDLPYGDYSVQVAGGFDLDVGFPDITQAVSLDSGSEVVAFNGTTQALPPDVRIWRVSEGGNGNAYQYVRGSLSWAEAFSASQTGLRGVEGHLATITSAEENTFVNNLRFVGLPEGIQPSVGTLPTDDMRAWIGLTDEAEEGVFRWITGEPMVYMNWSSGEPNNGGVVANPKEDYVEMFASGYWNDITGSNDLNQGFVVEWELPEPALPPFP